MEKVINSAWDAGVIYMLKSDCFGMEKLLEGLLMGIIMKRLKSDCFGMEKLFGLTFLYSLSVKIRLFRYGKYKTRFNSKKKL